MKILLLGSGGREHCLAWKMVQSPLCDELFIAPGNSGTETIGRNLDVSVTDFESIKYSILEFEIDMVVVGPEVPLVEGVYDFIKNDDEIGDTMVIGPSKAGAQLEGSKAFSKQFMQEFDIPTAAYERFNSTEIDSAFELIDKQPLPIVLKADGLAAGKGVIIAQSKEEAKSELKQMLSGKFGEAGNEVVIEQFLDGIECSIFIVTDGKDYVLLPNAKDYKKIGEGETGLNTGGMGAVSPVPFLREALMPKITKRIIEPTLQGLQHRDLIYKGFLYIGLMIVDNDPYMIEYNCRMGDPETQVVIPRIESDLVQLFIDLSNGNLSDTKVKISKKHAATIVLASGGYPESYEKGKEISGVDQINGSILFHAGMKSKKGKLVTNGGRVAAITSLESMLSQALEKSKANAGAVFFEGKYFRRDIGFEFM